MTYLPLVKPDLHSYTSMNIALAQIQSEKGDIKLNISNHIKWIEKAAQRQADLVIFPELSLTGYEPTLGKELALDLSDKRLDIFQDVSDRHGLHIAVGAPTKEPNGICISLLLFSPHKDRTYYPKQYLHVDEEPYFVAGSMDPIWDLGTHSCALAICYEITVPSHLQNALVHRPHFYLASSAKAQKGIIETYPRLSEIARRHSLPCFFVNGIGPSDDFISFGSSAIWDAKGKLVEQLSSQEEGLLMGNL